MPVVETDPTAADTVGSLDPLFGWVVPIKSSHE